MIHRQSETDEASEHQGYTVGVADFSEDFRTLIDDDDIAWNFDSQTVLFGDPSVMSETHVIDPTSSQIYPNPASDVMTHDDQLEIPPVTETVQHEPANGKFKSTFQRFPHRFKRMYPVWHNAV